MNYLKWLIGNYKYYKFIKKRINKKELSLWENKLPSQVWNKYPLDSTFNGKKVLNIGCGRCTYKAPNVINLDYAAQDGINIVHDLSKTPLPFETETFDFIIANHVLEHVPNWFECLKDMARILKTGGVIEIWIPPISSDSAFSYRDHINHIGLYSFTDCFNMRQANTNLMAENTRDATPDYWAKMELIWRGQRAIFVWWLLFLPEWFCNWAMQHLRNTVSEEGYKFRKRETTEGRI